MSDGIICAEEDCCMEAEISVERIGNPTTPNRKKPAIVWFCCDHHEQFMYKERKLGYLARKLESLLDRVKSELP